MSYLIVYRWVDATYDTYERTNGEPEDELRVFDRVKSLLQEGAEILSVTLCDD